MVMDDAGVVNTGVIESRPTTEAEKVEEPPAEESAVDAETAAQQPEQGVPAPCAPAAAPGQQRMWSMPTATTTRKYTDEFEQIAIEFGAGVATIGRSVAKMCGGVVTSGWHIIREVPPAVRLLGALGLAALLSIIGSTALDNTLGATCAVAFVPGFSLAFGAVAHHFFRGPADQHSAPDLERSIEYVDGKLACALNAFGTERHQQAVIALIQAKTATELFFGTAQESVQHGLRPRIKDGGVSKTRRPEGVSEAGRS